jgi:ribosomal protein S27E
MNGRTHADRVAEALGNMFMDITCSHCGSNKVVRAGAAVSARNVGPAKAAGR